MACFACKAVQSQTIRPAAASNVASSSARPGRERCCSNLTVGQANDLAERLADEAAGKVGPPAATHSVNADPSPAGVPLEATTRAEMEAHFGFDFSRVRIFADPSAAEMNDRLGARAFTHGTDIYFNRGEFLPDTSKGRRLLAHELAHVTQQGAFPRFDIVRRQLDDPPGGGEPQPDDARCQESRRRVDQLEIPQLIIAEDLRSNLRSDAQVMQEYAIPRSGPRGQTGFADVVAFAGTADVYEIKAENQARRAPAAVERYRSRGQRECDPTRQWLPGIYRAVNAAEPFGKEENPRVIALPGEPGHNLRAWQYRPGVIAYDVGGERATCDEDLQKVRTRTLPHALIEDDYRENVNRDAKRECAIPTIASPRSRDHMVWADLVGLDRQDSAQLFEIKSVDEGDTQATAEQADRYVALGNRYCAGRPDGGSWWWHRGNTYPGAPWGRRAIAWPGERDTVLWAWQDPSYPGVIIYEIDRSGDDPPRRRHSSRLSHDIEATRRANESAALERAIEEFLTRAAAEVGHYLLMALISRLIARFLPPSGRSAGAGTSRESAGRESTGVRVDVGSSGSSATAGREGAPGPGQVRVDVGQSGGALERGGSGTGLEVGAGTGAQQATGIGAQQAAGIGAQQAAGTGTAIVGGASGEAMRRATVAAVAAVTATVAGGQAHAAAVGREENGGETGTGGGERGSAARGGEGTGQGSGAGDAGGGDAAGGDGGGSGTATEGRPGRPETRGNAILPEGPEVEAFLAQHPEVMERARRFHDQLSDSAEPITVAQLEALLVPVTNPEATGEPGAPTGGGRRANAVAAVPGPAESRRSGAAQHGLSAADMTALEGEIDFGHMDAMTPPPAARVVRRRALRVARLPPGAATVDSVRIIQWRERGVPRSRFYVNAGVTDDSGLIAYMVRVPVQPEPEGSTVSGGVVIRFRGHVVGNWRVQGTEWIITDQAPVTWVAE